MGRMSTKYRVQNPKNNEIVATYDFISDDALDTALTTANDTFKQWREKSYEERAEVLRKVAKLFDDKRDELTRIIAEEMGKPVDQGDGEIDDVVEIFNYYADNGAEFGADEEIPNKRGGTSIMRKVPFGVILGIMPWNYPYYQVARFAAPALMAGNVVLVKHAEICPRSAEAIQKIFDEAGAPKGLFTNLYAKHSQISRIINDDRVQGVSLTVRARRACHRLPGRSGTEEVRARAGRHRRLHRARLHRRPGRREDRVEQAHFQHRPGLHLQQAHDRDGGHLRRIRRRTRLPRFQVRSRRPVEPGEGPLLPAVLARRRRKPRPAAEDRRL